MRIRMLGPVSVWNGAWTPVAALQQRVLLAALLVDAGQVVSTDRLVYEIWADRPPRTALKTVHAYVMRLRRLLGDGEARLLATRHQGYQLVIEPADLDALEFERLAAAGRTELAAGRPDPAAALLAEALTLWRGPVLADVPDRPAWTARVAQLEQSRLAAVEDHAAALLELGRHETVVGELHRQVEEHPLREGLWTLLMRAQRAAGRRADALATYQRARRVLRDELGLEPGEPLQRLQQEILTGDRPQEKPVTSPAPVTVAPAQLPADVRGFTGRERYLERLDALLPGAGDPTTTAVAIAAIAGTAGVGKTALAVHWAHRVRDRFPDGQLYIDLRGYALSPPVPPLAALARSLRALGVPAEQTPAGLDEASALYRSSLVGKRVLVLLDNAHHPDQVRPLLPGSPGCFALVTSRDRLTGLTAQDGAVPLALDPLTSGEAGGLVTRLLGDRAGAEPAAVGELARLCGYLPLALRIATANLASRPHATIAEYAAKLSADRMDTLEIGGDPPAGIRTAFDLSYAALPGAARRLFRLAGLVPGPDVTAPAAAALLDTDPTAAARLLDQLAGAHLVQECAMGRYTLHDLLRRYAAEKAAAEAPDRERVAALRRLYGYYQRHADGAAASLYPEVLRLPEADPDPVRFDTGAAAASWLDAERPNLVAAVAHAAKHGPHPAAWRLADALHGYLFTRASVVDWQVVAEAGLAAAETGGDWHALAAGRLSLARLHSARGRHERAIESYLLAAGHAQQAGWLAAEAVALGAIGGEQQLLGRLATAAEYLSRSLVLQRRAGWLAGEAATTGNLGLVYWGLGQFERAAEHYARVVGVYRQLGATTSVARASADLGITYHALGRLDEAIATITDALDGLREAGNRYYLGSTRTCLAEVYRDRGDYRTALDLIEAARAVVHEIGDQWQESYTLAVLAGIQHHRGDHQAAVHGHERALAIARDIGDRYLEVDIMLGLARAFRSGGRCDAAAALAREALGLARGGGYRHLEGQALTTLAAVQLGRGEARPAAGYARLAQAVHAATGHRLGQAQSWLIAACALRLAGRDAQAHAAQRAAQAIFADIGVEPAISARVLLGAGRPGDLPPERVDRCGDDLPVRVECGRVHPEVEHHAAQP